jgi:hypothetical protein
MICPQCRAGFSSGTTTCPRCSVALVASGDAADADLVTVFLGGDEPGFPLACSLLEDAGIPYATKAAGVQDLFGAGRAGLGYNVVTGPAEILVRAEDASRARKLLDVHPGEISESELAELAEHTPREEEEPGPSVGVPPLMAVVKVIVVLFPIWLGYDLVNGLLNMNSKGWVEFTTPGAPYYHPAWTWYRVADPVTDAALLFGSLHVLQLFRSNDDGFSKAMMILLSANFLTDLAGLLFRSWMGVVDWSDFREIQRSLGAGALWAICLLCLPTSEHVRASITD